MAVAFITGVVIGGLLGASLVYSHEVKTLRDFRKRVEDVERRYLAIVD